MNCDRCGRPSVYHSTLIVNGVSQTTNLCRDCAIKEGVFAQKPTSIFEDMFSLFSDVLPFEKVEDINCPVCKTSLREFKTTGKLGCPTCYDAFKKEIENLIKKIAPFDSHKQIPVSNTKTNKGNKLEELKAQMAQAVKEERYEDAAKLKKQIKKLEDKDE